MSTIGLDVGTSRVKAVRFDSSWHAADSESETTSVVRGEGGRSEQDMGGVWAAAARVLGAVARRSPDEVELLAVTAQGDGCWLIDSHGDPVGPALLWNDNRAASIVETWQCDGTLDTAFRISGNHGAPGVASAQLRWLQANDPALLDGASTLLSCGSWIYANLTGRRVLDQTEAANPFFAATVETYDDGLLGLFGIEGLRRLLPPTVSGADRVAPLIADVAGSLGLRAGTPVALAPYDVPATAVGTGVTEVGNAFAVLGTTLCVGVVADNPQLSRPPNGMTLPGASPGRWLIAYATLVGTEVLEWAARMLGVADAESCVALAATSVRDDLPLVLPYLSPAGERSPFLDADVRGAVLGLNLSHTRADMARGVVDGLTLAVVDCLHAAGTPQSLALSGGGARSALWCQAICDAVGVPVVRPDVLEVGARGAVLVGATDAGMFPALQDAVSAAVRPGPLHEPDAARAALFTERYVRFVAARSAARS